jgi:hypothetical protein
MMVEVTNIQKGVAIVHHVTESQQRGCNYVVDLSNRTCTCGMYQQVGIPCVEAWAVIKHIHHDNTIPFDEQYFHHCCLTINIKSMFKDVPSLFGILPSDQEISNFIVANNFQNLRAPVIISNPNISKTTKRIASAGESLSTKGVISSTSYKKQKIMCEVCRL